MHQRTNQGGSVVAFVIIGVVLASVVGGGVYLVNQRNKQTTTQQPSTSQPSTDNQESSTGSTQNQPSSQAQNNPGSTSGAQNPPTTGVTQTPQTATTSQLPATGPADTLVSLIAITSLTATATAYVRSKTRKRQSLAF